MIFESKNKTIQYCPTPKCGCTSTKVMIRKGIEGVIDYEEDIHFHYWTDTFKAADVDIKFCIVREPVSRFLSAYSNRVVNTDEWNIPFVELNEFIDNFHNNHYKSNERIHHHFRPQVDFIGPDPNYYDRVFFLDEMSLVSEFLSEIMGKTIKLEKLQTVDSSKNPSWFKKPIPTKTQINSIKSFYEDDYKFLKQIKK